MSRYTPTMHARVLGVAVAIGSILIACGGSDSGAARTYADARAVGAALSSAGLGCADYHDASTPATDEESAGRCTADGQGLRIATLADEAAQNRWIAFVEAAGCGSLPGGSSYALVKGTLWMIELETETQANQIAQELGGTAKVYECE